MKSKNITRGGRDEITKPKVDIIRTKINPFCHACFNGGLYFKFKWNR